MGSAATVTAAVTGASSRRTVTLTATIERTSSCRWTVLNPWTSTWSSYGLNGTLKNLKLPSCPVTAVAEKPVMSLRSRSTTPGIAAPSGPITFPDTDPASSPNATLNTPWRTAKHSIHDGTLERREMRMG